VTAKKIISPVQFLRLERHIVALPRSWPIRVMHSVPICVINLMVVTTSGLMPEMIGFARRAHNASWLRPVVPTLAATTIVMKMMAVVMETATEIKPIPRPTPEMEIMLSKKNRMKGRAQHPIPLPDSSPDRNERRTLRVQWFPGPNGRHPIQSRCPRGRKDQWL